MAESDFDSIKENGRDVPSGTKQADITAPTVTAGAPAAATVGADLPAFTDPPTAGEMAALRTFVNALKADVAALRTNQATVVTDNVSTVAKVNAIRGALDAFQETA